MNSSAPAQSPLDIDRIQSSRAEGGQVRLQLSGHWVEPQAAVDEEELLVVQVEGRRHRFPASQEHRSEAGGDAGSGNWHASFTVPEWAEPRQDGQAAVWVGNAVVPVPPLHGSGGSGPPAKPKGEAKRDKRKETASPVAPPPPPPPPPPALTDPLSALEARHDAPRSGPLADLLLKETVAALHAELEQRTADAARIRGALADSQSELEARAATQAQLEATLGDLRDELTRLIEAVEDQQRQLDARNADAESERAEAQRQLAGLAADAVKLRGDLAAAQVSRDAAIGEAAGLREELQRLGSELTVTRERVDSESGDLGEATRLLADARALTDEIQARRTSG
jgi:DNA repair exonuclease SbcCD ATPase subunit